MRRFAVLAALAATAVPALALPAGAAAAPETPNRPGAVYAATNDPTGNEIRVFDRAADGRLTPAGDVATGGLGSGNFEQSANSVVLGGRGGESSPINFTGSARFLLTRTPEATASRSSASGPTAPSSSRSRRAAGSTARSA
jgi:hypothetical protein